MSSSLDLRYILVLLAAWLIPFSNGRLVVRAKDSADGGDPFASISPSVSLKWKPCSTISLPKEAGMISCARLLVGLTPQYYESMLTEALTLSRRR